MFRFIVVVLVFLIPTFAIAQTAPLPIGEIGLSQQKLDQITAYLQKEVDAGKVSGVVGAISRHGKIGYMNAVGFSDLETKTKLKTDSLFRIASMTKAVTSAAVMRLVEDGEISLNDPVSKYIPAFSNPVLLKPDGPEPVAVPTIHDLLTHRSGLTYGWLGPEELDKKYYEQDIPNLFEPTTETMGDRVQRIAKMPLICRPGEAWHYSVSLDVLGHIVESVSGLTLEQFFRERFFRPLKMQDTFFKVPKAKQNRLVSLYTIDDDKKLIPVGSKPIKPTFFQFSADYCTTPGQFYSGGGGLVSTAHDYLRFLNMLLNGGELEGVRVLKRESVAEMTKNHIGDMIEYFPGHGDGFGYGFAVVTDRGASVDELSVGSYSWGGIFNTYFWVDPKEQLAAVLMTQVFPNDHLTTRAEFRKLTYSAIGKKDSDSGSLSSAAGLSIEDAQLHGLECYKITSPFATWHLDKVGAGLASMIDRDGKDWLSFNPEQGTGAAGEYRGFPNAVFQEAGNYFHALNSGTDPCTTAVEDSNGERIVISAKSDNGKWAGRYTFTTTSCTFTMTRKPEGHNFWVLYEGTPGGEYDDSDWWMTSGDSTKRPLVENHEGDLGASDGTEWIAFGDKSSPRMIVLTHDEDDAHPDRFYQVDKSMTVFGFGRKGMKKYLESVPQNFTIGFVESNEHSAAANFAAATKSTASASQPKVAKLARFALSQTGNPENGKKLFHDSRTKCATCHRVGDSGGEVGPDLTSVGGKFDRTHLIDSLLYPSRQIGYGYETTIVLTDDGQTITGVAKESDDAHVTLLDPENKRVRIAKEEIEQTKVSNTSIMPVGLEKEISDQEFVDLISYMETLGPGDGKFGNGVTGPVELPDGFQLTTVATGLSGAVAMEIAPDGRIFVCEQGGTLLVIKDGAEGARKEELLSIPVELNWERGLIGVTVAPEFPRDPFVYLVYVTDKPYTHHRVSRFRFEGDRVVPQSEEVLFRGDDQSKFGGHVPAGHQGGGIHFGPDGKLYVGIGEQTAGEPSQRMDAIQGKILRINPDGTIPNDNPFLNETTDKYRAIWAKGCRNPFTFSFSRAGDMLINDVGGKFEEINRGVAGANYGWPNADHGPTDREGITGPVHHYPESCINGGDFCDSSSWPEQYRGKYFFADFNKGWVKFIDPDSPEKARDFLSGIRRPVDLRFAPDGSLYILLRNAWVVDDKFQDGTGALVKMTFN